MALYSSPTPLGTTLWARQYYNHCRWGTRGSERFLGYPPLSPKFRSQKDGARIQLQNFWLQVQSSFLYTCSLTLLGLDFTVKGVEANLKSNIISAYYEIPIILYGSDPDVNSHVAIPEKKPFFVLCSATCLGDWSVFQIPFGCETKIGHIVVITHVFFENLSSPHSQAKERWLESKQSIMTINILYTYTNAVS